MSDLLWPPYATPDDLTGIEAIPLQARGLPETTYALLTRAADLWPDRVAVSVLPDRPAGRSRSDARSPSSSPTSAATPTCCTSSAWDAATRWR